MKNGLFSTQTQTWRTLDRCAYACQRAISVALLAACLTACGGKTNDAGTANSGADGGSNIATASGACVYQANAYDSSGNCLNERVAISGVCVHDVSTSKSVYDLCVQRPPDSTVYLGPLASARASVSGDGWTFGPSWLADLLHVPRLSAEAEQLCVAMSETRPDACSTADAGDVDGPR